MRTVIIMLALSACQPDPEATSLFHNVGMSFEPCNEAEIKFRNERYGFMPVLKVCGSNNVAHYAWNPSGTHIYFDLTMTGNLIDASQAHKPLSTLPFDQPSGQPTWISDSRIVVPVVPDSRTKADSDRLALFDIRQLTLSYASLPGLTEVTDVQRGRTPAEVFFVAVDTSGVRSIYAYDFDDGSITQPFPWAPPKLNTLSVTIPADAVVIGSGDQVTLYNLEGGVRGTWRGRRGTVHPGGEWLAIEKDGEEVSIFYQRSWENQTRREREITKQKADKMAQRFPDWYPKTVKLPTLEFINLQSGHRGELYSVYGSRFQWYERQKYYASFLLWGYEGKQLNRNVQLGDLSLPLGAIQRRVALPDVRLLDENGIHEQPLSADSE